MSKEYKFTCAYCNHKWTNTFYHTVSKDDFECPQCKDTNVSMKEIKAKDKKDYYGAN